MLYNSNLYKILRVQIDLFHINDIINWKTDDYRGYVSSPQVIYFKYKNKIPP